jgi:hypothetical protein
MVVVRFGILNAAGSVELGRELAEDRIGRGGRDSDAPVRSTGLAPSRDGLLVGEAVLRCAGFLATGGAGFPLLDCWEACDVWDASESGRGRWEGGGDGNCSVLLGVIAGPGLAELEPPA